LHLLDFAPLPAFILRKTSVRAASPFPRRGGMSIVAAGCLPIKHQKSAGVTYTGDVNTSYADAGAVGENSAEHF